jgi:hypothetical protein
VESVGAPPCLLLRKAHKRLPHAVTLGVWKQVSSIDIPCEIEILLDFAPALLLRVAV